MDTVAWAGRGQASKRRPLARAPRRSLLPLATKSLAIELSLAGATLVLMAEMEVYWGSGSQPSWRVLLALEVKGVAYDSKLISFQKREHKTPEFLEMNPRGKVPTVKDGEFSIFESVAVLAYLDAKYPEPPLFGTTIKETGQVWQSVMEFMNYVDGPLMAVVRPVFFGKVEEHRAAIDEAVPRLTEELQKLDESLKSQEYLVGGSISAADIVAYPPLMSLLRAGSKPIFADVGLDVLPLKEKLPHLAEWMARIELLPGYDKTYPPHWRES
jgi:glutathione S-transferase